MDTQTLEESVVAVEEVGDGPAGEWAAGRCALCGRLGAPLGVSLTTPEPAGALLTVRACAACAAATPTHAALVRALFRCATAPPGARVGGGARLTPAEAAAPAVPVLDEARDGVIGLLQRPLSPAATRAAPPAG